MTQTHNGVKPLFIPVKTEFFEKFKDGSKTTEYRQYSSKWSEKFCYVGRPVVISKGFGNLERLTGVIVGYETKWKATKDWITCYGVPGRAACIHIKLDEVQT